MYNLACVVNVHHHGNQPSMGTCCGIVLDSRRGLVLAHATCLSPFVEQGLFDVASPDFSVEDLQSFSCEVLLQRANKGEDGDIKTKRVSKVDVSTHANEASVIENGVFSEGDSSDIRDVARSRTFYAYSKFSARVVDVFQCRVVAESLEKLLLEPSWELLDKRDAKETSDKNSLKNNAKLEEAAQKLLSSFIVLRLENWVPYSSALHVRPTRHCQAGDGVEICSTPFGGLKPDAFMNSFSRGIVSNLAGKDHCLLLSDARCILGGEGAPLYTFQQGVEPARCLTGLVIASLTWKNEEWVGFCVACDISAVLQSLPERFTKHHQDFHPVSSKSVVKGLALLQGVLRSPEVVMVEVGSTWGSGVVVDYQLGVILTCSHVIKEARLYPVRAKRRGQQQAAEKMAVLYRQHPVQHQFDLAVLKCQPGHRKTGQEQTVAVASPAEGMEVFMIGHALFGSRHNLQPSATSGVISKIIKLNSVPVMIQTTCAVHPGASGGALVDTKGHLLGIVVCNARDNTSGASFPHINMSIPVCTVWPLIQTFIKTQDVHHLKGLKVNNALLDTLWSLGSIQNTATCSVTSKL